MSKVIHSIHHMCIDISGYLRRYRFKNFADGWTLPDGTKPSRGHLRDWLRLQLHEGKRVLPLERCEGFNYQTGCPGHIQTDVPESRGSQACHAGETAETKKPGEGN